MVYFSYQNRCPREARTSGDMTAQWRCDVTNDTTLIFPAQCFLQSVLGSRCESPIEESMLLSLTVAALSHGVACSWVCDETRALPDGEILFSVASDSDDVLYIEPQSYIGDFRVDFLVTLAALDERRLIVECDGHDFHEKTKEQARHAKSRDRCLVAGGLQVFHFTGSEIYRDPLGCAEQVLTYLLNGNARGGFTNG